MMPDLQSCIVCDDVRQERNGKFILIGLFDAIGSPTFPMRHPRLFIVTRWCSGDGVFKQKTRILKPDQATVLVEGKEIPVHLQTAEAVTTNVEMYMNIGFEQEGTHWIEVLLDNDMKIRFPLRINKIQPPPGAPLPPEGT